MVVLTVPPFVESVKVSKSMSPMVIYLVIDLENVEPMLKRTSGTKSLGSV
jgi:hypothetical protein